MKTYIGIFALLSLSLFIDDGSQGWIRPPFMEGMFSLILGSIFIYAAIHVLKETLYDVKG
jgi:hypothetical protein